MINRDLVLIRVLLHVKILLFLHYNIMDNAFAKMILIKSKNMVQQIVVIY